jgi:hypothetical protein
MATSRMRGGGKLRCHIGGSRFGAAPRIIAAFAVEMQDEVPG